MNNVLVCPASKLQSALCNPHLQSLGDESCLEAAQAAYDVAVALGLCRMGNIELPQEIDGTLDVAIARRALQKACQMADSGLKVLNRILDSKPATEKDHEAVDAKLHVIEMLHDLEAVRVALQEASAVITDADFHKKHTDFLLNELTAFNAEVLFHAEDLQTTLTSNLLRNLREGVRNTRWNDGRLPWYLDGETFKI